MTTKSPVEIATEIHFRAANQRDRETWLNNLAEDVHFEDPVGMARLSDPDGKGLVGRDAVAEMWDMVQENPVGGDVVFDMDRGFVCGNEIAYVGRTRTILPKKDGEGTVECIAEGVFCYRVNADGKIDQVRAFFDFEEAFKEADLE